MVAGPLLLRWGMAHFTWEDLANSPAVLATHVGTQRWPGPLLARVIEALDKLYDIASAAHSGTKRIVIWRAVNVARLRDIHWDNIGGCWSYEVQSAHAYHGMHVEHRRKHGDFDPMRIRLRATVKMDDVDWHETIRLHMENPGEREIRLKPGTMIDVDGGFYWAPYYRDWLPLNFRRSFRARVHELDRYGCWMPFTNRRRR